MAEACRSVVKAPRRQEGTLAKSKVSARGLASGRTTESRAKLASDEATIALKAASLRTGVSPLYDVEVAEKLWKLPRTRQAYEGNESGPGAGVSLAENAKAVGEAARSVKTSKPYLVYAPVDGVVTERNVHKGTSGPPVDRASTTCENPANLKAAIVVAVPETSWRHRSG